MPSGISRVMIAGLCVEIGSQLLHAVVCCAIESQKKQPRNRHVSVPNAKVTLRNKRDIFQTDLPF